MSDRITFDISICPTNLEPGDDGDIINAELLLQRIRDVATGHWGDGVRFQTLQIGYAQGDQWAQSWKNGKPDDSLATELLEELVCWQDDDLYE